MGVCGTYLGLRYFNIIPEMNNGSINYAKILDVVGGVGFGLGIATKFIVDDFLSYFNNIQGK